MANKVSEKHRDDELNDKLPLFDRIFFPVGFIFSIICLVIWVIFLFFFGVQTW